MADSIGIAGTAVGIVSLGLQVYCNLKTYLTDFKGCNEYVTKVLRQLELLHGSLGIIERITPAIEDDFELKASSWSLAYKPARIASSPWLASSGDTN